jgi:hypothetical protein
VNPFVADTIEVLSERKGLHSFEESRMIRKHVFKRSMLLAGFAHDDAPSFLYNLCLDNSRSISEVRDAALTPNHTVGSFSIALGTE